MVKNSTKVAHKKATFVFYSKIMCLDSPGFVREFHPG